MKVGALLMVVDGHSSAQGAAPRSRKQSRGQRGAGGRRSAGRRRALRRPLASPAASSGGHARRQPWRGAGNRPKGRITEQDVERVRARPEPGSSSAAQDDPVQRTVEAIPFRGIRRRIAEAMETAYRTIPHVSGFHEFDAAALFWRCTRSASRAQGARGHLTFLPFIVKATVAALSAQPYLNASLDEAQGAILLKKAFHIGLATSAPDGLVVPVIHHADRLDRGDRA